MKKLFLLLAILCGFVVAQAQEQEEEIIETVPVPPTLVSTVTNDTIHLYWDFVIGVLNYTLYYGEQKLVEYIDVNDTAYAVHVPMPGTYCFTVTATNGVGESEHSNEACGEIKAAEDLEIPAAPVITATVVSDSAVVKWEAVEFATYYNVYLVQEEGFKLLKATNVPEAKFVIKNQGSYCFVVKSGNLAGESEYSNEECITYVDEPGEGIEEFASSFNVYPNPVNDVLFIETEVEINEVVVYTITGVIVGQQSTVNSQQSTIDVANLNSGVYFVKIVAENGEVVKRFVKK